MTTESRMTVIVENRMTVTVESRMTVTIESRMSVTDIYLPGNRHTRSYPAVSAR